MITKFITSGLIKEITTRLVLIILTFAISLCVIHLSYQSIGENSVVEAVKQIDKKEQIKPTNRLRDDKSKKSYSKKIERNKKLKKKKKINKPKIKTLLSDNFINFNGENLVYEKKINGTATAYTAPKGKKTSIGKIPKDKMTIAVNKNVIPYGKEMVILCGTKQFRGTAEDTGGDLMKGRIVADIFMKSRKECINFGRRNVTIYVLRST
ncbi:MAG: 3D domain-containing protein [Firmicutes bacterium]|nr:3D domain-containing protein [Bacillota bacterium]